MSVCFYRMGYTAIFCFSSQVGHYIFFPVGQHANWITNSEFHYFSCSGTIFLFSDPILFSVGELIWHFFSVALFVIQWSFFLVRALLFIQYHYFFSVAWHISVGALVFVARPSRSGQTLEIHGQNYKRKCCSYLRFGTTPWVRINGTMPYIDIYAYIYMRGRN